MKKETETFSGKVVSSRTFTYKKEGEEITAGELIVLAPSGEKRQITLFGDACSHADGLWMDETSWSYVSGPKLAAGQYVRVEGVPSEKEWQSDKFGLVIQKRIAVFDPRGITRFEPARRPGPGAAPVAKAKARPKRPI